MVPLRNVSSRSGRRSISGGKAESIAERAFAASTDEEVKAWLERGYS